MAKFGVLMSVLSLSEADTEVPVLCFSHQRSRLSNSILVWFWSKLTGKLYCEVVG